MGKRGLSGNNAQFVSVDLIGEKNQVILEFLILSVVMPYEFSMKMLIYKNILFPWLRVIYLKMQEAKSLKIIEIFDWLSNNKV